MTYTTGRWTWASAALEQNSGGDWIGTVPGGVNAIVQAVDFAGNVGRQRWAVLSVVSRGRGCDDLTTRDQLFADETVDSLLAKIEAYQASTDATQ